MSASRLRLVGLLLAIAGSTAGAFLALLEIESVNWVWFSIAIAVGALGVAMVQWFQRVEARDATRLETNFGVLEKRLAAIVQTVSALDADKASIDVYDLPDRIDATVPRDVEAFVDARESIAHAHGAQAYADVMTHFAAAERYLNRVWSTAADGYIDEAHTFLGRSTEQFEEALRKLRSLR